ncbi:MAG: ComF family protein [Butyrivibrio sp.]|nr:ComF family protein [Butyrivibrio sp.]
MQKRDGRTWLCEGCGDKITYIRQPMCFKCGKQLDSEERELCRDCTVKKHNFDRGVAAFGYSDAMKKSMYAFKYGNRREYAAFYAKTLLERYGGIVRGWNAQAVVPVPLHPSRYRSRGYNQAEVLAREIGRLTGIAVDAGTLVRTKKTTPQKELSGRERNINIENAFQIAKSVVKYKSIIIVDDIYTTGATIDECALTLKAGGADRVYFMSVCIGNGF